MGEAARLPFPISISPSIKNIYYPRKINYHSPLSNRFCIAVYHHSPSLLSKQRQKKGQDKNDEEKKRQVSSEQKLPVTPCCNGQKELSKIIGFGLPWKVGIGVLAADIIGNFCALIMILRGWPVRVLCRHRS